MRLKSRVRWLTQRQHLDWARFRLGNPTEKEVVRRFERLWRRLRELYHPSSVASSFLRAESASHLRSERDTRLSNRAVEDEMHSAVCDLP
jgi:hypothetical protein